MTDHTPARRSRRARVPNTRYSLQALQIPELDGESDEEERQNFAAELAAAADAGEDDDEDFDAREAVAEEEDPQEEPEDEPYDDVEAMDEDEGAPEDDESDPTQELIDAEGNLFAAGEDSPARRSKTTTWIWTTTTRPAGNFERGLSTKPNNKAVRNGLYHTMYGEEDAERPGLSLDRWVNDLTFPSRIAILENGGLAYPAGFDNGVKGLGEDYSDSKPFFESFEDKWKLCQSSRVCLADGDAYRMYLPRSPSRFGLLTGPYHKQTKHDLLPQHTMSLHELFPMLQKVAGDKKQSDRKSDSNTRDGWVINAGSRVLSLAWAPAKAGYPQYLAISLEHRDTKSADRTSFVPSEPYPASIQIWRFSNKPGQHAAGRVGLQQDAPKLVRVICASWGTARRLVWCPGLPTEDETGEPKRIGIIATIWADGHVRVLEVDQSIATDEVFSYFKVAAFSTKPPDTVCTCVDWLNTTDLAVGCSNGFVGVWNVADSLQTCSSRSTPLSDQPRPWLYQTISDSYISSIVSARPIAPHLIETISVAGFQQLTDLRNPRLENVNPQRSRLYQTSAAYSPHMQCFVTTDESGDVVVLGPRRFFSAKRSAPSTSYPTQGVIVATSPVHCSALFGTPEGAVSAINPARRLIKTKIHAWTQKWFVHEWRQSIVDNDETAELDETDVRQGVVRMTEGYKVDKIREKTKDEEKKAESKAVHLFEEEQAVTALAWNPNLDCGGWAAAGMGSGLVRVEDIAVDIDHAAKTK